MLEAKKSVLIVDDERDLAELLGLFLEESFQCQVYSKPLEALAKLSSTSTDYLITDIEMPDVGGLALVETARRLYPNCGIFVSTGHDPDHPKVRACITAGANGVIMKPFADPANIRLTLQAHKA